MEAGRSALRLGAPPSGMVRGVRGDRAVRRPTARGGARDHGAGARGAVQHTGLHRRGVRPPGAARGVRRCIATPSSATIAGSSRAACSPKRSPALTGCSPWTLFSAPRTQITTPRGCAKQGSDMICVSSAAIGRGRSVAPIRWTSRRRPDPCNGRGGASCRPRPGAGGGPTRQPHHPGVDPRRCGETGGAPGACRCGRWASGVLWYCKLMEMSVRLRRR